MPANKDQTFWLIVLGIAAYWYYTQQNIPLTVPAGITPPFVPPVGYQPTTPPFSGNGGGMDATAQAMEQGVNKAAQLFGSGIKTVAVGVAAGAKWIVTSIASTGPVGIAVAAGVIVGLTLFEIFRSSAHDQANDIVTQLENPFGVHLSELIDPKDQAANAGTLTCAEEDGTIQAVEHLWTQYQQTVAEFRSKGGNYDLVGQQSLDNLNGPRGVILGVPESERYGASGFVDATIAKMQWHMQNVLQCS